MIREHDLGAKSLAGLGLEGIFHPIIMEAECRRMNRGSGDGLGQKARPPHGGG
jgi:hypothetical protein